MIYVDEVGHFGQGVAEAAKDKTHVDVRRRKIRQETV